MARALRPLGVVAALAGAWILLRLLLAAAGGVPGRALDLQRGRARVAAPHVVASGGEEWSSTYGALVVGAWRALWFLPPTQLADGLLLGLACAAGIGMAAGLRALTVAVWERVSRPRRTDLVESAAFVTSLLATFQALLLPAW